MSNKRAPHLHHHKIYKALRQFWHKRKLYKPGDEVLMLIADARAYIESGDIVLPPKARGYFIAITPGA